MKLIAPLAFFCFLIGIPDTAISQGKKEPEKLIQLKQLKSEVHKNLTENILPYWKKNMVDHVNGGFFGRIDYLGKVYPETDKGGILNARILWTFSSAYRITKDTSCLSIAKRAKDYILTHFIDREYGGAYRSVSYRGQPSDTRKQTYTQSFFIYALSEYYRATADKEALEAAKGIFRALEKHALDPESDGYFEIFDRSWKRSEDLILGEKDSKDEKTMNTHLHMLEAYAGLYRVWPDPGLGKQLRALIGLFTDKIINTQSFHLNAFLTRDWQSTSTIHSYGHDIEASWLLVEAAEIYGDKILLGKVKEMSLKMADASAEGLQLDGSMIYEKDYITGHTNYSRSWWPQAETIVGYVNAYELSGMDKYLDHALKCWDYTNKNLVDNKAGEWFSDITPAGNTGKGDKAGFWKCPYHNGRMCMEIMEIVSEMQEPGGL